MKSTFGKKLFRYFLVFALTPTIILSLIGYYLTVETRDLQHENGTVPSSIPANYFNELLFNKINSCVDFWTAHPHPVPYLDFLFVCTSETVTFHQGKENITDETIASIRRNAGILESGFVESDNDIIQYIIRTIDDSTTLCAGLVHDEGYQYLIETIQTDFARRSSEESLDDYFIYFLAFVFILLTVLMIILSYFLSKKISTSLSSPLQELSLASQRISKGEFKYRIDVQGVGEIKTLIENFNHMTRQLETTTARLAQAERVAAWRQLARRFAHELRNPLQPILVSLYRLEKILKDSELKTQVEEPLRAASEEIKHLTKLADRFSSLAKLPAPTLKMTSLNELLTSIATLYREQLQPFDFHLNLPNDEIHYEVDETYFREAVHNLLKNAIEASPTHETIVLGLDNENGIAVYVKDNGPGMSEEILRSARIPYFTTKEKGSGIGLAVVEKIANELNGQLIIQSGQNEGTKVTILLPGVDNGD